MVRRRRSLKCGVLLAILGAGAISGCSGGNDIITIETNPQTGQRQIRVFPPAPDSMKPMTLFEKRRLAYRIAEDPKQLQRLTPRERREVLGMVQATSGDDEEDR